ncbi:MAG TPA: DNA polymerase IV [bacterium]|nr:DNA polymerase IV [bacterium]
MERRIIHIDVNSFAISVERVLDSKLRKRPVVVAYPGMERCLVLATSLEARQAGLYRGMALGKALRHCRDVMVIPPNEPLYSRAMSAMMKIVARFTPLVEPVRYGHAYLDMTGTGRLFGVSLEMARKIQQEIQQRLLLPSSVGVAGNKLVSKIASEVTAPAGIEEVQSGFEREFIAPLKVYHLPSIEPAIKKQLLDLNIRLIREVADLSPSHLTMLFGRIGLKLHQAAHGIDHTPVFPPQQLPNIYQQQTLPEDSNDIALLYGVLYRLVEKIGLQLRRNNLTARKMILEIAYADHRQASAQTWLLAGTNLDHELFTASRELLDKILTRRIRVRRIAVRFFQLRPRSAQLSLFDEQRLDEAAQKLNQAMDKIREKFGQDAVKFARG